MTPPEWGLILGAAATTFYFLGIFRTLASVGIFLAVVLVGINGHLVAFASRLLAFAARLVGSAGAYLLGAAASTVLIAAVVVIGIIVLHGWSPRNAAKKKHFWLALILGVVVAAGATGVGALNGLHADLTTAVSNAGSGPGLSPGG